MSLQFLERGIRHRKNRDCGDESISKGREPCQMGWYAHAVTLCNGDRVLDVGCGVGDGLALLATNAGEAVGIDVDERLGQRDDVTIQIRDLRTIPEKSFDTVVCIDVIEHIEDDWEFVRDLARVARRKIYLSTPNYAASFNRWPYHVREYTPRQLERLVGAFGPVEVYGGDSRGEVRQKITNRGVYYLLCDLYCYRGAVWIARILRRLLGQRVWPHQAVVVNLTR
jgi:2-polyprenyl-3-methyl-5-hydroxy-6-metoxy-1,4-benzoquinol methylase